MAEPMVWFDFGGVLSPPLSDLYTAYEHRTGVTRDQLESAMALLARERGRHPLAELELGLLTQADWGGLLRAALLRRDPGLDLSRARLESFAGVWFQDVSADPTMVQAVRLARDAGCRTGILTNNVVEWEPYWREIVRPAGPVDHVIDSCRLGVRKPDPEIFDLASRTSGAAPEDCLLIDDQPENCAAARAAGWRSIHFRTGHQTLADLLDLLERNGHDHPRPGPGVRR